MTVVFDIFSKRRRFNFDLENRCALYCGFVARMCKFLRCRSSSIDHINRINDMFEKAKGRMENECDIIEIMDQIRRSKNFQRNFLSHRQKILLKFDRSNVIYQDHGKDESDQSDANLDIDEKICKRLDSENKLAVVFTVAKLFKILTPYIEEN